MRDLFLITVYTGLRYSDLAQLRPEHIHNSRIELISRKTQRKLSIAIKKRCAAIIEKYPEGLPMISEQRLNDYIKELCTLAGMDMQKSVVGHFRRSENVPETKERSSLVSVHTGRRTMITLSLDAGHLPRDIMKVTGHSDYKTLAKYDRSAGDVTQRKQLRKWWDERGSV